MFKKLRRLNKLLAFVLMLGLLMSTACTFAFADDANNNATNDGADTSGNTTQTSTSSAFNPYVYESLWDGQTLTSNGYPLAGHWYFDYSHTGIFSSKHTLEYWFCKGDIRDYAYSGIGNGLFHIIRSDSMEENYAAYCADFVFRSKGGFKYRMMNLEESTYFDDNAAAHIRGIFANGYWHDWESDLENKLAAAQANANSWLTANNIQMTVTTEVAITTTTEAAAVTSTSTAIVTTEAAIPAKITGLTRDEAITATQLAVWNFANNEGYGGWGYDIQPDAGNTETETLNIQLFRDYLIAQEAQPQTPDNIMFSSDGYFVTSSAVFTQRTSGDSDILYDVTLRVKLAADIETGDSLALNAKLAERETKIYPLTETITVESGVAPESRLFADNDGYYTITFEDVTASEAALGINLIISGTQALDGVYFFQSKPENEALSSVRTTAQNMVGKFTANAPVSAETSIPIELGTQSISLIKYASAAENTPASLSALAGVKFNLYAEKDNVTHLVKSNLTTDSDGKILLDGLPSEYDYFFKETKSLDGYVADYDTKHIVSSGSVTVINYPAPDDPDEPTTPSIPDPEPETPSTPTYPEYTETTEPAIEPTNPVEPGMPEVPESPDVPSDVPETGDNSIIWFITALLSAIGLIALLLSRKYIIKERRHF